MTYGRNAIMVVIALVLFSTTPLKSKLLVVKYGTFCYTPADVVSYIESLYAFMDVRRALAESPGCIQGSGPLVSFGVVKIAAVSGHKYEILKYMSDRKTYYSYKIVPGVSL